MLGLPGNPVASLVCSNLFLKPLIARLAGRPYAADIREAELGAAMAANDAQAGLCARRDFAGRDGLVATPFGIQDSSMLKILADAERADHPAALRARSARRDARCRCLMLR